MKRICLLVLVGLPAAGKTTFCHWLLNVPQQEFKILHFCYDVFLETDHFEQETVTIDCNYKTQRQEIFKTLEIVLQSIVDEQEIPLHIKSKVNLSNNNAKNEYIILLDDNHFYRSMRYKIYQLCKSKGLAFGQIYFVCDQQMSLDRNTTRSLGHLPNSVIEKMANRFEAPSSVHYWEAITHTIDVKNNTEYSPDCILSFVSKAFAYAPKNEIENILAQNKAENSALHNLDISLRRRMGELLTAEICNDAKRIKAADLNKRRKEILKQFRDTDLVEKRLNDIVNLLDDNKNFKN